MNKPRTIPASEQFLNNWIDQETEPLKLRYVRTDVRDVLAYTIEQALIRGDLSTATTLSGTLSALSLAEMARGYGWTKA